MPCSSCALAPNPRRNIFDALAHVPQLAGGEGASEEESEQRRNDFIDGRLIPALNSVGHKGW